MAEYIFTIDKLIPSGDVRRELERQRRELTDFEQAYLIWNMDILFDDKLAALEKLCRNTDDRLLKKQIDERLKYTSKVKEKFMECGDDSVFVLTGQSEEDLYGCFADYKLAYRYGTENYNDEGDWEFRIIKYPLYGKSRYMNYPESEIIYGRREGEFIFDVDGKLKDYYLEGEKDLCVDDIYFNRFEDADIKIPVPFKEGDLVRTVGMRSHYTGHLIFPGDIKKLPVGRRNNVIIIQSEISTSLYWFAPIVNVEAVE